MHPFFRVHCLPWFSCLRFIIPLTSTLNHTPIPMKNKATFWGSQFIQSLDMVSKKADFSEIPLANFKNLFAVFLHSLLIQYGKIALTKSKWSNYYEYTRRTPTYYTGGMQPKSSIQIRKSVTRIGKRSLRLDGYPQVSLAMNHGSFF